MILCGCAPVQEPELFGLMYGKSLYSSKHIFHDGDKEKIPFGWFFWAVKEGDDVTLIDCGVTHDDLLSNWKIEEYTEPAELLAQISIHPDDVSKVIITHTHADHMDGCDEYSNAEFFIQRREWDALKSSYKRAVEKNKVSDSLMRRFNLLSSKDKEGNLTVIGGDRRITDAISVELHPYHTKGIQSVIVDKSQKTFNFVIDNAYVYENFEDRRPVGTAHDEEGNAQFLEDLSRRMSERYIIIPGHDLEVLERFEKIHENIVRFR